MGTLAGIEFFTATVEAGSFASAARRLGVTASAVSRRVAQLERELGVPLLSRTTRSLSLTHDGRAFHERCVRILGELREAHDAMARASQKPSGLLRVEIPVALGHAVITPKMPLFLAKYPAVRLELTLRDSFVDPVAEGIDILVRIGPPGESALIARRLGASQIVPCAAPAYLARRGTPKAPSDLAEHDCLGYLRDGRPDPWRFVAADGTTMAVDIKGPYHANDAAAGYQAALAGRGLVALFDFVVKDAFARGELVRVLENYPMPTRPIHALYPKNRHLLPKVRVFLDFLVELFRDHKTAKASASGPIARTDAHTADLRRAPRS
ncbi:LysR family transcriptional regulator [Pendulispora rubella]|uniref:LysR family transcriptional regulator n=1 Tax=Pendulispora rubella TaxID=2741070 RepID=A0ABZ2KYF4_9BACT